MNINRSILCFCKNITVLRRKHRLTYTEMANILHISRKALISIENGEVSPEVTADTVIYAVTYFKISASELFDM